MKREKIIYCERSGLFITRISYSVGQEKYKCLIEGETEEMVERECYKEVARKMLSLGIQPFGNIDYFNETEGFTAVNDEDFCKEVVKGLFS